MATTATPPSAAGAWYEKSARIPEEADDDDDDDDIAPPPTAPPLFRRSSASSTTQSLHESLAAFSELTDDNDAASSLAPFLLDKTDDVSSNAANPGTNPFAARRRRRSSLLRTALAAFRRPSDPSPTAPHILFTSALTGDIAQLSAYHAVGGCLTLSTYDNLTALHLAAGAGNPAIVDYLLTNTASATQPSPLSSARSKRQDRMPLYFAAAGGSLACARLLLDPTPTGGSSDISATSKFDGGTVLHAAARNAHCEMISLLLDAGADVNRADLEGLRPLNWAVGGHARVRARKPDAVRLLLERGAVVNQRTNNGFMVLQSAVTSGNADVVRVLLEHHTHPSSSIADVDDAQLQCTCVNADAPFSMRAIHSAVFANRSDILSLLIDAGADVEARIRKGWTPLHIAARFGYLECKRVLLEAGADLNALTNKGWTPEMVAKRWDMSW